MQWNSQYSQNSSSGSSQRPVNYKEVQTKQFFHKNGKRIAIIAAALLFAIILLSQSTFIVHESEQAVVSRFGVIKKIILNIGNDFHEKYKTELADEISFSDSVVKKYGSGLHFKVPFVDKVETYSARLNTYVSDSEVVNTLEKKQYYITTYAQWHITDPALFSLKLGSMNAAENQLDNLIHPVIVQAVNKMNADDFISNKEALNRALQSGLNTINYDMSIRGIEVVDIQIHRTILPSANLDSTYARMQADRAKVAQQLRSEGDEEYNKAVAAADLEVKQLEAQAVSESGTIRGEADAAAAEIYAQAYSVDSDFYSYWRSLQALKKAVSDNSTLVLDRSNPLFAGLMDYIAK